MNLFLIFIVLVLFAQAQAQAQTEAAAKDLPPFNKLKPNSASFSTSESSLEHIEKTPAILEHGKIKANNLSAKSIKFFEQLMEMALAILKLETLVLFTDAKKDCRNFEYFASLRQDKIIINQPQKWQIRTFLSSNVLNVVFLDSAQLNHELLNIFNCSIHRWHLRKVLFITETSLLQSSAGQWRHLFEWLHQRGFWNSLLLDNQENTLLMDHFSLDIHYNTVSVGEFFQLSIEWSDLKGHPVHVSVANDPPKALIYRDKSSNKTIFGGYYGSIINIFAEFYNASLVTHVLSDLDYVHELDCLPYIEQNKVDICGLAMSLDPYSFYVMTNPEELVASYLIVPVDKPLDRFYYLLKPFHWSVWWLMLITFLYTTLALSLIHRVQHGSWMLAFQLQYGVLSFIYLPVKLKRVRGALRPYLELLLIFKGFVFSNLYLTLLASLLYTRLYSDIDSLKDLQRLNISIIVTDYEYLTLNASDMDPIIKQQLIVVADDFLLEHRRNLDDRYAYYSQYDKNAFYLYQQKFLLHHRMQEMTEVTIQYVMGGMPMRFNWPFEHLLNNIFNCILDTGLSQYLMERSREEGIRSGYLHFFHNQSNYVESMSWEYFYLAAMVLAGGYFLGFVSFLMEILYFKKFARK